MLKFRKSNKVEVLKEGSLVGEWHTTGVMKHNGIKWNGAVTLYLHDIFRLPRFPMASAHMRSGMLK